MSLLITIAFVSIGILSIRFILGRRLHPAPLPPGPKPWPLIGNILDLPPQGKPEWTHWHAHKELYGPISSISAFGEILIIVNDAQIAIDLLDKKSHIYSDRPKGTFAELAGWKNVLGALEYTERIKRTRKMLHKEIGSNAAAARFNTIHEIESRRFLFRLLHNPPDLVHQIRKETGAIILDIGYGYTIEPFLQDPLVDLADHAMTDFSIAVMAGYWVVDFLPILKYIPSWFLAPGFVQTAKRFRERARQFSGRPYAFVKNRMIQKNFKRSFLSNILESSKGLIPGSDEESVIEWAAASLYAGGSDTTVSTLSCFFLAMALYPETQKKAQEELDRVVGSPRLPTFTDRENLPYINALVKEALRWHPVAPMGVAHKLMADDCYNGYFLPKGSVIMPNIWGFCHNPSTYSDPMVFKPERFLDHDDTPAERDPRHFVFGFGRRVCPGRALADLNIFLNIARTLAVFNIRKPVRNGKTIHPDPVFLPGVVSHPAPFEVDIHVRSPEHEELILTVEKDYPWGKSDAEIASSLVV